MNVICHVTGGDGWVHSFSVVILGFVEISEPDTDGVGGCSGIAEGLWVGQKAAAIKAILANRVLKKAVAILFARGSPKIEAF